MGKVDFSGARSDLWMTVGIGPTSTVRVRQLTIEPTAHLWLTWMKICSVAKMYYLSNTITPCITLPFCWMFWAFPYLRSSSSHTFPKFPLCYVVISEFWNSHCSLDSVSAHRFVWVFPTSPFSWPVCRTKLAFGQFFDHMEIKIFIHSYVYLDNSSVYNNDVRW